MFGLFSSTVLVTFIDGATGEPIATSKMPAVQLPDTFALDTEMDLAGEHYAVIRAEPQTKAEFIKTKTLTVTLRKLQLLDPRQVLFSLPTLCGAALPASAAGSASDDALVLHEDDWRQCEFVAGSQRASISAELAAIRRVHAVAAAQVGWREVHVRDRIVRPLPAGTTWAALARQLGDFESAGGVAFGDPGNPVAGAVAARLPHRVTLWGVEEFGELTVLCVQNVEGASPDTIATLKRVADTFSLALVHWCRCQVYIGDGTPIAGADGVPWDAG